MPGYVFIKLVYSSQLWFMLTNTRGVTGFVGPNGRAWPLEEDEVKRLRLEDKVVNFDMVVGDCVKVVSGPFTDLIGVIKSIDTERQKAQVSLNMFGRETAVIWTLSKSKKSPILPKLLPPRSSRFVALPLGSLEIAVHFGRRAQE